MESCSGQSVLVGKHLRTIIMLLVLYGKVADPTIHARD